MYQHTKLTPAYTHHEQIMFMERMMYIHVYCSYIHLMFGKTMYVCVYVWMAFLPLDVCSYLLSQSYRTLLFEGGFPAGIVPNDLALKLNKTPWGFLQSGFVGFKTSTSILIVVNSMGGVSKSMHSANFLDIRRCVLMMCMYISRGTVMASGPRVMGETEGT